MHIVAIDGPAGSGKSSVSKTVASRLNFGYLDTGAAYRALTWYCQQNKLDLSNLSADEITASFQYSISLDPNNYRVTVGEEDVTEVIRLPEVANSVSKIAQLPEVRKYMLKLSRSLVEDSHYPGVVVEGRDITTIVFPEAQTRILLTAKEEVRLLRRQAELSDKALSADEISKRDKSDSQVVDFMSASDGVTLIDSSNLNFEETVRAVIEEINRAEVS